MRPPCTVDDLLRDARVRTDAGGVAGEDAYSLRRLEEDFAAAVRHGTAGGGYPRPALGSFYPVPGDDRTDPPAAGPPPRREKAAHDLRTLSAWAVRTPRAAHHLAGLASTHQMEPDGALVFGCLLHLADRDDQAEFLWQFAAGAGKAASAECLHLLHTTRGDLRQARHWAVQAADLDTGEGEAPRAREARPLTSPLLLRTWRALRRREPAAGLTADLFHTRAGTLPPTVTTAVQRLVPASAPFPTPLWPDASLADRLRESTRG
jgi:hypothetical protein